MLREAGVGVRSLQTLHTHASSRTASSPTKVGRGRGNRARGVSPRWIPSALAVGSRL